MQLSPYSWNKSIPSDSSPCPHCPSPHISGHLISPPSSPLAPQARPATLRLPRATTPRTAMPPTTTARMLHTWSPAARYRWGGWSRPLRSGERAHAPHMEPGACGACGAGP